MEVKIVPPVFATTIVSITMTRDEAKNLRDFLGKMNGTMYQNIGFKVYQALRQESLL